MPDRHVVVVGGGISGLSAAWYLINSDNAPEVTVLESSSRMGGKIQTTTFDGLQVDNAADAFLRTTPDAVNLCKEIGIADELIAPHSSDAWLWLRHKLRRYPEDTFLGVPSRLRSTTNVLSLRGLLRASAEPLLPARIGREGHDPSIGSIIRKRFGDEVADRLVGPLVGSINAGSIDNLSSRSNVNMQPLLTSHRSVLRSAKKLLSQRKGPRKSPFLAPNNGMQTLTDTLVECLRAKGARLQTNETVVSVCTDDKERSWRVQTEKEMLRADAVIVATPAHVSAQLLRDVDAHVATLLASIRFSSVALVRMTYARSSVGHFLDGSGFVVPEVEGKLMTACSWASSKWQRLSRPDHVVFRVSAGRFGDNRAFELDDNVLMKALHDELSDALSITGEPTTFDVTRWPDAFAQYEPGHNERRKVIEGRLAGSGIHLAGSSLHGVGIPACISSGKQAAEAIVKALT